MREARESSWCIKKSNWKGKTAGEQKGGCSGMTTNHITHGIFLESELIGEVKEYVFYFLRRYGYLAF